MQIISTHQNAPNTLFYISNHQRVAFYSPFDHQSHKRTVPFKWYHLKIAIICNTINPIILRAFSLYINTCIMWYYQMTRYCRVFQVPYDIFWKQSCLSVTCEMWCHGMRSDEHSTTYDRIFTFSSYTSVKIWTALLIWERNIQMPS